MVFSPSLKGIPETFHFFIFRFDQFWYDNPCLKTQQFVHWILHCVYNAMRLQNILTASVVCIFACLGLAMADTGHDVAFEGQTLDLGPLPQLPSLIETSGAPVSQRDGRSSLSLLENNGMYQLDPSSPPYLSILTLSLLF